jgi:hypothetical protein
MMVGAVRRAQCSGSGIFPGHIMDTAFFTALILSLSTGAPTIPAGSGTVYQQVSEFSEHFWRLEGGFTSSSPGRFAVAPRECTAVCTFDFTQLVSGMPMFTPTHTIIPFFSVTGPVVSAAAQCTGVGRDFVCDTEWASTPVRFSAVIRVRDLRDPLLLVQEFTLVGSGVGIARNHREAEPGPWNYSDVRYDFTYTVVPEPAGAGVAGVIGGALLVVTWRRRRATTPQRTNA